MHCTHVIRVKCYPGYAPVSAQAAPRIRGRLRRRAVYVRGGSAQSSVAVLSYTRRAGVGLRHLLSSSASRVTPHATATPVDD